MQTDIDGLESIELDKAIEVYEYECSVRTIIMGVLEDLPKEDPCTPQCRLTDC